MHFLRSGLLALGITLLWQLGKAEDINSSAFNCSDTLNVTDKVEVLNDDSNCLTFVRKIVCTVGNPVIYFDSVDPKHPQSILTLTSEKDVFAYAFDSDISGTFIVAHNNSDLIRTNHNSNISRPLFSLKIFAQEQGGFFKNEGQISFNPGKKPTERVVYALSVENGKQVVVTDIKWTNGTSGSIRFFDGFSNKVELAKFGAKDELYPVFSSGSEMLVVLYNFTDKFSASFNGVKNYGTISQESSGAWKINSNFNETHWIIRPNSTNNNELIALSINELQLSPKSTVSIYKGYTVNDANLVLRLNESLSSARSLYLSASSGAHVVTTSKNLTDTAAFSYNLVPECGFDQKLPVSQDITSSGYPNQYYYNSNCQWDLGNTSSKTIHVVINDLDLSVNDTLTFFVKNLSIPVNSTSDDLLLLGDQMKLVFNTETAGLPLEPKKGFGLSIDVNDCGFPVIAPSNISTPKNIPEGLKCTWFIVAKRKNNTVNNIHLNLTTTPGKIPPVTIYDGSSIKDSELHYEVDNKTGVAVIVSRTNKLVIKYNAGKEKTPFKATFDAVDCPTSEQCGNKICMHPSWRCNGINDCGDYTDEQNCAKCQDCGHSEVEVTSDPVVVSPKYFTTDGIINCCWNFNTKKKSLEAKFIDLKLANPTDILTVFDGEEKIGTYTSDFQQIDDVLLTIGNNLTLNLFSKKFTSVSNFTIQVIAQDVVGRITKEGTVNIPKQVNQSAYFGFEVESGKQVGLTLNLGKESKKDWTVKYYDGFSMERAPLLSVDSKSINNPVVSISNKMLVEAKNFHDGSAGFKFSSVPSGLFFVNQTDSGSLHLDDSALSSFSWQIKPTTSKKDSENTIISLEISALKLTPDSSLSLHLDDDRSQTIAEFKNTIDKVKILQVPTKHGIFITYVGAKNQHVSFTATYNVIEDNIVTHNLKPEDTLNIKSPNYPNIYPVYSEANWTIDFPKGKVLHLSLVDIDLADKHPLTVYKNTTKDSTIGGRKLPDDLILDESPVLIAWNSKAFNETLPLGRGFSINLEVLDCGSTFKKDDGHFETPNYPSDVNETLHCKWLVTLTNATKDKPNMVNFSLNAKDNKTFTIYNGGSVRDKVVTNFTDHLSLRSRILVSYVFNKQAKTNTTAHGLQLKYNIQGCEGKVCNNSLGLCIHKDWICNGVNDCGDNTDELNCKYPPPPPTPSPQPPPAPGVSKGWLVASIFLSLIFGALLAIFVPILYRRYTGRSLGYSRFGSTEAA